MLRAQRLRGIESCGGRAHRFLAADLRGGGVRANSILPSIIDTEANRNAMLGADFAAWPKPEDIARVILFLASDDAKVIHGAAIPVYGKK
jgi:NAD(P)-dependent dehydrogenase (short-subunit alcohol dehydrogenase family)